MYPRSMFLAKIRKLSSFFQLKVIDFIAMKKCCILHGRVFVMLCKLHWVDYFVVGEGIELNFLLSITLYNVDADGRGFLFLLVQEIDYLIPLWHYMGHLPFCVKYSNQNVRL